jgi:hypothetical protein
LHGHKTRETKTQRGEEHMKYLLIITLCLAGCSQTCEEMGGTIKAKAPIIFMEGEELKTVYITVCKI